MKRDAPPEAAPAARPCPICGKPASVALRPFCSKRCADVDLNRWLTGSYAVPVVEEDDAPDTDDTRDGAQGREPDR